MPSLTPSPTPSMNMHSLLLSWKLFFLWQEQIECIERFYAWDKTVQTEETNVRPQIHQYTIRIINLYTSTLSVWFFKVAFFFLTTEDLINFYHAANDHFEKSDDPTFVLRLERELVHSSKLASSWWCKCLCPPTVTDNRSA